MQRRDLALLFGALVVAAGCVRLGIWQLDRLAQRKARNAALAGRIALPMIDARAGNSADSARQRRVRATGKYEFAAERTWPGRGTPVTAGGGLRTGG